MKKNNLVNLEEKIEEFVIKTVYKQESSCFFIFIFGLFLFLFLLYYIIFRL